MRIIARKNLSHFLVVSSFLFWDFAVYFSLFLVFSFYLFVFVFSQLIFSYISFLGFSVHFRYSQFIFVDLTFSQLILVSQFILGFRISYDYLHFLQSTQIFIGKDWYRLLFTFHFLDISCQESV